MDKNALKDTKSFFFGGASTFMALLIAAIITWLTSQLTNQDPIIIFIISLMMLAIIVQTVNEIRWAYRRKKGFVDIVGGSNEYINESEKQCWLEISIKNEMEKIKFDLIIKRVSTTIEDDELSLSSVIDLIDVYVVKNVELENHPEKIVIASILEDILGIHTEKGKYPLRILLDKKKDFSDEQREVVLVIKGKIDENYVFSEMYKGLLLYGCSTDPKVFVGKKQVAYHSCAIKWESPLIKWSQEEEDKIPYYREIRNLTDKENLIRHN